MSDDLHQVKTKQEGLFVLKEWQEIIIPSVVNFNKTYPNKSNKNLYRYPPYQALPCAILAVKWSGEVECNNVSMIEFFMDSI